jgi:hypothetical protein
VLLLLAWLLLLSLQVCHAGVVSCPRAALLLLLLLLRCWGLQLLQELLLSHQTPCMCNSLVKCP